MAAPEVTALLKRGKRSVASFFKAECFRQCGTHRTLQDFLNFLFDPKTKSIDDLDVLDWCRWLIAGGATFDEFGKTVRQYDNAVICGLVWTANFVAYRCRTCGISPCMSLCSECFQAGDHEGHDFNMFRSQAGGACDCGDISVMNKDGFCSRHGPDRHKFHVTPPSDLLTVAEIMMPRILLRLIHYLRDSSKQVLENRDTYQLSLDDAEQFLTFLHSLSDMGAAMRSVLSKALTDTEMYKNLTEGMLRLLRFEPHMCKNLIEDAQSNFHYVVDCGNEAMKDHCYWPIVSDLINLLSHREIAHQFLADNRLITMWIELLSYFQGMNLNQRELCQHVEFEPETYYAAFSAELEIASSPMWSLLSHCREKPNPLQLTFHLPLHRYLATFMYQAIQHQDVTFKDIGASQEMLKTILLHLLQMQVCVSEIYNGMWVRNGLQIKGQAMTYIQCHFCYSMIDADLYLMQAILESDIFHILKWLSFSSEEEFSTSTYKLEPNQELAMVDAALSFLATILGVRTYLGSIWENDFDPVHVSLRAVYKKDVQSSMDRYTEYVKHTGKYSGNGSPWPPFKPPGNILPVYKDMFQILHCRTMHAFIFRLLNKCVTEPNIPESIIYHTIHLLNLSLTIPQPRDTCRRSVLFFSAAGGPITAAHSGHLPSLPLVSMTTEVPMDTDPYPLVPIHSISSQSSSKPAEMPKYENKGVSTDQSQKVTVQVNESIVSLLVKLHSKLTNKQCSYVPLSVSNRQSNNSLIGDGPHFVAKVLDQICKANIECAKHTEEVYRTLLPKDSPKKKESHDKEERRRKARERQQKLMAQFASQQKAFMEQNQSKDNVDADDDMASASSSEQAKESELQSEDEHDCVICGKSSPPTADNPIGLVVLLQATSALGHRLPNENPLQLPVDVKIRYKPVNCASVSSKHLKTLLEHFEESSVQMSVNIGWEGGVLVQTCGHYLHLDCHNAYKASQMRSGTMTKAMGSVMEDLTNTTYGAYKTYTNSQTSESVLLFVCSVASVEKYHKEVPLMLKDPVSLLIQLVLTLPSTIEKEHYLFLVKALYNVTFVQALITTSCKFTPEEREAWKKKGRMVSFNTLDGMLSHVITRMGCSRLYEDDEMTDKDIPAICQSVWSPHSVDMAVQESCIPFLRIAALLKYHLFSEEFTGMQSLLMTNNIWMPPSLIVLPQHYYKIFQAYSTKTCSVCSSIPKDPAICLVCGHFLCFRQSCCSQQSVYECIHHSVECGAGTGMYLLVNSSIVVVIRGPRATLWGSVYLDEHGEEDRDLKRGKPLFLSAQRYNLLKQQWISHNFDHSCKRWIWHLDRL
ncbi:hypothetical protein KUTeg_008043 [Tegillarca granosa]|uniref:E3 ubiquitin-protein ligase n=1 Tax=Tegillarca granosa TaxID=220873 RepID=A0ABQ9FCA1_TEGGR|nr:hypothetical protein KUTeg_008043 [Tegillarca granosa]